MLKAMAFDLAGRPVGHYAQPNRYVEDGQGAAEQDMHQTWEDAVAVLVALVGQLEGVDIAALVVTGQGDGTWLVDAEGEPVGPGWLWLDARSGSIIEAIRASDALRVIFQESGTGPAASNQSGQLLWLRTHRPEQLARATTAMHCKDWLYFRLTGIRATDPSEGCFTFGSWRTRAYADTVIDAFGLRPQAKLLPPIIDGMTTHHALAPAAASRLGIPAGTPVVLGYVDVVCSALGVGLYGTGHECGTSIIGSTGMSIRLADDDFEQPVQAPMSGYRMVFPVKGKTALLQSTLAATLNIDWLVGLAAQAVDLVGHKVDPPTLLKNLDALAATARPATAMWHPYIAVGGERGPFTDVRARASLSGVERTLAWPGMMRSIYEGLALAAGDCYEAIGGAPPLINLTGGAARSATLRQIFAAILQRPVRGVGEHGGGVLGAAMIAAVSIGVVPDLESCVQSWLNPILGAPESPDPTLVKAYDGLLPIYQAARQSSETFWHQFGAFGDRFYDK